MESTYFKISRDNVNSSTTTINGNILSLPSHIKKGGTQFSLRLCNENIYLQRKCCQCKKTFDVEIFDTDKKMFLPIEDSKIKITSNNFYNDRCICCQSKKDAKNLSIDFTPPVKKSKNTSDSELCQLNIVISAKDKQQLKLHSLLQGRTLKEEVSNAIKFYIEHIEKNENP